LFKVIENGVVW